nr:hypothetical protein [Paludibacter sp.]
MLVHRMVRKVKGSKVLHKIGMRDADPAKPTKDYDYKGMKITLYKNGDRWVWQLEGKSGTGYGRGEYSDKEGAKFDAEFEADKIMKGSRYKKIENKDSDPRGYKVSDQIIKGFLIYKSGKGPATFFAKNENGKEFEGTMEQIKRQIDDYWVKQDEEVMKQKMRDALEGQSFSSLEAWQQYAKKHLYKIERSGGNWFAYKTAGGRPVGQFDVDKQRGTLEIYKDSKTKDDLHSEAKPWAKKVLLAMRDIYKSSGDDNIYDLFNDAMGRVSPPSSLKAIIRIYILSGANFGYSEGVIFKGASAGYLDSKTKDEMSLEEKISIAEGALKTARKRNDKGEVSEGTIKDLEEMVQKLKLQRFNTKGSADKKTKDMRYPNAEESQRYQQMIGVKEGDPKEREALEKYYGKKIPITQVYNYRMFLYENNIFKDGKSKDKYTGDPLTKKGQKIMAAMKEQYGKKKGTSVFYASKNKGTISGEDG